MSLVRPEGQPVVGLEGGGTTPPPGVFLRVPFVLGPDCRAVHVLTVGTAYLTSIWILISSMDETGCPPYSAGKYRQVLSLSRMIRFRRRNGVGLISTA